MRSVKEIRRANMRALAESIGGITAMAEKLGKSQSQISHLIGFTPIKNIGDRISAEVEKAFNKPYGWLDKEHFGIMDSANDYAIRILSQYITVPHISWAEANQWQNICKDFPPTQAEQIIPVMAKVSKKSFALRIQNEQLGTQNCTLASGTIIIVDPQAKPKQNSYVVIATTAKKQENADKQEAILGQYVVENGKAVVKPMNPRHATLDASSVNLCGVVKQSIMVND